MMLRGGSRRALSVVSDAGVRAHPELLAAAARDALLARLLALTPGAWTPAAGGGSEWVYHSIRPITCTCTKLYMSYVHTEGLGG